MVEESDFPFWEGIQTGFVDFFEDGVDGRTLFWRHESDLGEHFGLEENLFSVFWLAPGEDIESDGIYPADGVEFFVFHEFLDGPLMVRELMKVDEGLHVFFCFEESEIDFDVAELERSNFHIV